MTSCHSYSAFTLLALSLMASSELMLHRIWETTLTIYDRCCRIHSLRVFWMPFM